MAATGTDPSLRIGEWLADPSRDVLQRGDEVVKIEPKAMEVLCLLAARQGQVVPQAEIEAHVWRDVIVTPQSVYQSVAQLRRVLGDNPREPRYIETVPRRGYRLVAPVAAPGVTGAAEPPQRPISVANDPEALANAPASITATPSSSRWSRKAWAGVAVLLVLLVAGFAWTAARSVWAAKPRATSIVVLGFQDLSPSQDQAYLANAIAEELTSALGQVAGLQVAASGSARIAAMREGWTIQEIADELGVTHVLRGSVRRVGDRVRVIASVVEAESGYEKWTRTFERPAAGVARIPADIAAAAAGAIGLALIGDPGFRGSRMGTRSPNAFDYYMLGQQRFAERTAFGLAEAERYFQLAVEADPGFAAAYTALADVHIAEYYFVGRTFNETAEQLTPLIDKALQIDPNYGQAHAMRGWLLMEDGDYDAAERELRQAVDLAPNDAKGYHWLGMTLQAKARPAEALVAVDRALEIDPLNFIVHIRRALILDTLGRNAEADESATRAVTLAPRHPNPRWTLALLAVARGNLPLALSHYESALALDPTRSDLRLQYATYLLDSGRIDDARREIKEAGHAAESSHSYMGARAYEALLDGDRRSLAATAASLAAVEPDNRFFLGDAANWMTLAGEHQRAIELFGRALAKNPAARLNDLFMLRLGLDTVPGSLAASYSALGRIEQRNRLLHQQEQFLDDAVRHGMRSFAIDYQRAVIAALRGQDAAAMAHLDQAASGGWRRTWWASVDPAFSQLRTRPEFVALLSRTEALNRSQ